MTSEFTLGPTAEFFKQHDFFCLDPDNVVLFEQRMLPVVTLDGKAILEQKHKVAMAPGRPRPPPSSPAQGSGLGRAGMCLLEAVWLESGLPVPVLISACHVP